MEKKPLFKKNRLFIPIICGLAAAMFMISAPSVFFLNLTPSLPRGLYLRIPATSVRKGDLVVYTVPDDVHQLCREREYGVEGYDISLFLKKVGGMPGDLYGVDANLVFRVNGKSLGNVKLTDTAGREMPVKRGVHVVPEGQFLPVAPPDNSLDGRYIGTVSQDMIVARAIPFITEFW